MTPHYALFLFYCPANAQGHYILMDLSIYSQRSSHVWLTS